MFEHHFDKNICKKTWPAQLHEIPWSEDYVRLVYWREWNIVRRPWLQIRPSGAICALEPVIREIHTSLTVVVTLLPNYD